jgi:glycosyltransferase involved in cell wall biosynthesis
MVAAQVSVVIPTRDRADLLRSTLRSVVAQRDVDTEVIVVDDGSTSPAAEVVTAVAGEGAVVLRNPTPGGVSRARNVGAAAASGDWIAFLDDDDLWAADKLAAQIAAGERTGASWVLAGAAQFDHRGVSAVHHAPAAEDVIGALPWRNVVPGGCSNVVMRRDALPAEPFDPALATLADWDLWIRLAEQGAPAVVPQVLVAYRLHGDNLSSRRAGVLAEAAHIERKHAAIRGGRPLTKAWIIRWQAWQAARSGDRTAAVALHWRAGRPFAAARTAVSPPYDSGVRAYARARRVPAADRADVEAWLRPLLEVDVS